MGEHIHNWKHQKAEYLICNGCQTVSTISDALKATAHDTKRDTLSALLMQNVFKKDAKERIYAEVMATKGASRVNLQARLI